MDLSDPRIWKDGTEIVLHNFHIIAPLIAATAAAAWWLRGALIGKTIDNLEQEVKLREVHIQILGQQLRQADDSGRLVSRNYAELQSQVRSLSSQVSGSSKEVLKTVETIKSTIAELSNANSELSDALTSPGPNHNVEVTQDMDTGVKEFSGSAPPNLTHTKVLSAQLGSKTLDRQVTTWNGLLNETIMQAATRFRDPNRVKELIRVNSVIGKKEDQGYRYIESAGVSVQGQDANSAWKATSHIANVLHLPVGVLFIWYDKEEAAHPGQTGKLMLNL